MSQSLLSFINQSMEDTTYMKLACPVLSSVGCASIVGALTMQYYSSNRSINSISKMLAGSSDSFQALLPGSIILTGSGFLVTTGLLYHARMTNKKLNSKKNHEMFFYQSMLQYISYAMLQSSIAVTIRENETSHYVFTGLFFLMFPLSSILDTYIYHNHISPHLPKKCKANQLQKNLKLATSGIASLGSLQVLASLATNSSNLIFGEFVLMASMVTHSLSLYLDSHVALDLKI